MATTEDQPRTNIQTPSAPSEQPRPLTSSGLYRWGVAVARRRRLVLCVYALLLSACAIAYPSLQKALGPPSYQLKNSDSARVEQLLETSFPGLGSEGDALVFHSTAHLASEPVYRRVIAAVDRAVRPQRGVRTVLGPYDREAAGQITSDEHTAITAMAIGGSPDQRFNGTRAIQQAATRAAGDNGVQVWLTGYSPGAKDASEVQQADSKRAQAISLPLALLILLLAMGALVAAILPLLFAVSGLLLAGGVLAVLVTFSHFDSLLLAVMTMIGLGLGIDYSLFIVSRFREELARADAQELARADAEEPAPGRPKAERVNHAVGIALATSGRTIVFSGVIVASSLASLFVVDSQFLREIAIGAVVVAACMIVAALTLLPAALSLLGRNVNRGALPRRLRPADVQPPPADGRPGGWARWAMLIMRHPVPIAGLVTIALVLLATPALHLREGLYVTVLRDTNTLSGKGQQLLAKSFSPGAVDPLQIVLTGNGGPRGARAGFAAAKRLTEELELDPRISGVAERRSGTNVLLLALPSVSIDSLTATALVEHVRRQLAPPLEARHGPTVLVGGSTAEIVDLSKELRAKSPLILAVILGLSLLFLLLAFRSVVLPIKAVLMNLLATAATMGLVVLVFQDGHGQHLLQLPRTGFIQIGVPQIMFALLFGLSMDYEVFLIRRMQEEWRRGGDNTLAVARGMEHTARPITAAAAIMVAVFGSLTVANMVELQQLGFVLAAAIAIDATLVRLVLVPAVMRLFGAWNWWLPPWLARVLPDFDATDPGRD